MGTWAGGTKSKTTNFGGPTHLTLRAEMFQKKQTSHAL